MANKKLIIEVLAAHVDQRLRGFKHGQAYATLFPEQVELSALLTLADRVKKVLTPIQPSAAFKDQLRRDLVAAAYLKQAEQADQTKSSWVRVPSPKIAIAITMLLTLTVGIVVKWWSWKEDIVQS